MKRRHRVVPVLDRRSWLSGAVGVGLAGAGCTSSDGGQEPPENPTPELTTLSKAPFVQLIEGGVRLRFETLGEAALTVTIEGPDGTTERAPDLSVEDVTFERDFLDDPIFLPDLPGVYAVQDVVLTELEAGAHYAYRVEDEAGTAFEGSFLARPASSEAVRIGWLADTSYPMSEAAVNTLLAQAPDLVVYGGDLQYQPSPLDTWSGFFEHMRRLSAEAVTHFIVGNHEFEDQQEITQMFDRLFAGQGTGPDGTRYFELRYGPLAFFCLDSESGGLDQPDSDQVVWFSQRLSVASSDPSVRRIVVGFHRPVYTLSKHVPSDTSARDAIHSLLVEHGVELVLSGHAHCYERFVVDGVHYVVDGGGGAVLYDPDEGIAEAEALRPGESMLRASVSGTHGCTLLSIEPDGTMSLRRYEADSGSLVDEVELPVA